MGLWLYFALCLMRYFVLRDVMHPGLRTYLTLLYLTGQAYNRHRADAFIWAQKGKGMALDIAPLAGAQ